jgi:hypothetical protein
MVGQHDAPAADANGTGGACDVADENGGGGAGEPRNGVMLCEPEALVSEVLHMLGKVDRPRDRTAGRFADVHTNQIENRNRQPVAHVV